MQSTEVLLMSVSKDIERLTGSVQEMSALFQENQRSLNQLIIELREHKATDSTIHADFARMQQHMYGTPGMPGLLSNVHDIGGKMGNIWKVLWTTIAAVVTTAVGVFFTKLSG